MPAINYEKEWHKIATRLEWNLLRLQSMLARATQEDERAPIMARIASVSAQIEHAHSMANTYAAKRIKSA